MPRNLIRESRKRSQIQKLEAAIAQKGSASTANLDQLFIGLDRLRLIVKLLDDPTPQSNAPETLPQAEEQTAQNEKTHVEIEKDWDLLIKNLEEKCALFLNNSKEFKQWAKTQFETNIRPALIAMDKFKLQSEQMSETLITIKQVLSTLNDYQQNSAISQRLEAVDTALKAANAFSPTQDIFYNQTLKALKESFEMLGLQILQDYPQSESWYNQRFLPSLLMLNSALDLAGQRRADFSFNYYRNLMSIQTQYDELSESIETLQVLLNNHRRINSDIECAQARLKAFGSSLEEKPKQQRTQKQTTQTPLRILLGRARQATAQLDGFHNMFELRDMHRNEAQRTADRADSPPPSRTFSPVNPFTMADQNVRLSTAGSALHRPPQRNPAPPLATRLDGDDRFGDFDDLHASGPQAWQTNK